MNNKVAALSLAAVITLGLIYTHPAYAHNFGGDASAAFLAKVPEIKTEVGQIAKNVGNNATIDYYATALSEYWNANDTREMNERNALLAQEIPSTINATITDANAGDTTKVNSDVTALNGYLDEAIPVRIDPDKLNNSTVQALAVTYILKEALEKYGDAINSTVDLNDMSMMNMNSSSMSGGSMQMSVSIVDQNKYENAKALAAAAQQMWNNLAAKNSDKATYNDKISTAFTKLLQDMDSKTDGNTIMVDVHMNIHPNLMTGYNLQLAVPEFPLPALLITISILGAIMMTRFRSKLR
ncbi:MAG: hypothetical protein ACREA3_08090 [Nitrosotalea sp.]